MDHIDITTSHLKTDCSRVTQMETSITYMNNSNSGVVGSVFTITDLLNQQQYYILCSTHKHHNFTKLQNNLHHIVLIGTRTLELEQFWDSNDIVIMSTLSTNKGIGTYKHLSPTYDIGDKFFPPLHFENFIR